MFLGKKKRFFFIFDDIQGLSFDFTIVTFTIVIVSTFRFIAVGNLISICKRVTSKTVDERVKELSKDVRNSLLAMSTIVIENEKDEEKFDDDSRKENINERTNDVGGKLVRKYVPIVRWLPRYSKFYAVSDLIAGITLGLTMIPQSIAYASLAGLTAQYGLYSSFIGGFIYVFFGTIKEVSIGTTSLMALVTASYTRDMPVDFVILLSFITGLVQLLMGLLGLGFLVDFISIPVTSGFTSATSIIIIASQLRGLFGLSYKSGNVVDTIIKLFEHIGEIRLADTALGLTCIILLLLFRKLKDIDCSSFKGNSGDKMIGLIIEKILWILSTGRNALIVFIASLIAFNLQNDAGSTPFVTSGKVVSGLPSLKLPPFSSQMGNQTYNFIDMCHHLGFGMIMVPVVGVLTNVAIAKAFVHDSPVEASQEMLTLGLCNLAGSLVSSMPTCGAFTRSAVSSASGIQTPFAGIYSGTLALLALSFLTPYFGFIPKATLAAVLICAVIFLIDLNILRTLWNGSKRDAFIAISTFLICIVFDVEMGLFIGTALNALFLLYLSARPSVEVSHRKTILGEKYLSVKPEVGLFYPAIDYLETKITQVASEPENVKIPVVVDFERLHGIDYTAVKGIERLLTTFEGKEQKLFFVNVSPNVKLTILKLCSNLNTAFRTIDSEASLIDLLESELSKCPTEPIIAVTEDKGMQLEKIRSSMEARLSDPREYESLLVTEKRVEKTEEASTN